MSVGEIVSTTDVTSTSDAMSTSAVPLSLRSADLASGVHVGDSVDIIGYLILVMEKVLWIRILILGGVSLIGLDDSKNALGEMLELAIRNMSTVQLRIAPQNPKTPNKLVSNLIGKLNSITPLKAIGWHSVQVFLF